MFESCGGCCAALVLIPLVCCVLVVGAVIYVNTNGSSIRSCQIIGRYAEGTADHDWKVRQGLECAQTGQIDRFSPLMLLSVPGFCAPGSANYAAIGISGVRRMSPTVITRSVMPRAMAGVRSRYLRFNPGIGSRNDSCGRARW